MATKPGTQQPRVGFVLHGELADGYAGDLASHDTCEALRFVNLDIDEMDLTGIHFEGCALDDVRITETNLRASRFTDTTIVRLNAPILKAARSTFREVTIDGSRIGSAEMFEASLNSVHVSGSKLGFLNLRTSILQDVQFTGCSIDELDLGGAKITRVAFAETSIATLTLTNTTIKHLDLRGAEIGRVEGLEGLRGVTVSPDQLVMLAPSFAAHFGLIVED